MRNSIEDNAMGTSATVSGKRGRAPADVAGYLDGPPQNQEKRCCVDALRVAFVVDKEAVKGRAQRRNPELKSRVGSTQSSAVEEAEGCRRMGCRRMQSRFGSGNIGEKRNISR